MNMNKKGISPLIATVLVIGFVIALAAIMFPFITNLTKTAQEKTTADAALMNACGQFSTQLVIKNAVVDIDKLKFTLDNQGTGKVRNFIVKLYSKNGNVMNCNLYGAATTEFLDATIIKNVILVNAASNPATAGEVVCTGLAGNMFGAGDTIVKMELVPEVYNTATKLNQTCNNVIPATVA